MLISAPIFGEAALFHRPSRTLLLTDMVQNFEAEQLPLGVQVLGHVLGVMAPYGKAPVYLRLLIRLNKRQAVQAIQRLLDLKPERVIFAHGTWFNETASVELRRTFEWLLPGTENQEDRGAVSRWLPAGLAGGGILIGLFIWRRRRRNWIQRIAEDLLKFINSRKI